MNSIKNKTILRLEKITKTFGDFPALKNVSFSIRSGEIHALLGENGAGKSTLMNVVAGLYAADYGEIIFDEKVVTISGPSIAKELGIGMVHQHYKLVGSFTALENIRLFAFNDFAGKTFTNLREKILSLCNELGFFLNLDTAVEEMSVAEQQRVEILKTLLLGARIIILDEPTSVLTDVEALNFFKIIQSLAAKGTAIVLVTHKMKEALDFSDRISVMRNGELLETTVPSATSREKLVELIVGDVSETKDEPVNSNLGNELLTLKNVSLKLNDNLFVLEHVNFTVHEGEILGIAGVGGNGQTELVKLLSGLENPTSGEIWWKEEKDLSRCNPGQIRGIGVSVIPADRKKYALAGDLSIYENFGVTSILKKMYGNFLIRKNKLKAVSKKTVAEYDVQGINSIRQNAGLLSGGNAQKLVIAREFSSSPSLIVAHSPSRGLDVKAATAVHSHLKQRANKGAGVILISEDLDEILLLSNRIVVLHSGRITGTFEHGVNRHEVGKAMVE